MANDDDICTSFDLHQILVLFLSKPVPTIVVTCYTLITHCIHGI